ncbi:DNA ligase D [Pontibacter liquoris]|uniref:DNA ligase D n=1 Tax=Pontibacter liquoris TaxID=2905677 RepID=UPI001FA71988|nr:DNA ligase D [Pontibacter liquoris]
MTLEKYNQKRNFNQTPEPQGKETPSPGKLRFVVHRHQASKLHYDFRLEMAGVLKSWAVPKGPSLNPSDKRLAVAVEDHPYAYRTFEGDIPEGNYGAGHVDIWDEGTYYAAETDNRIEEEKLLLQGLEEGSIKFVLQGNKLQGEFALIKMKGRQEDAWLLLKKDDAAAVHDHYDSEEHLGKIKTGKKKDKPAKKTATASEKNKTRSAPDKMPHHIKPMMAKLTDAPFDNEDWLFEIKWDGYRAVAEVQGGKVDLYSRSGKSYEDKYKPVTDGLAQLGHDAVLDGEIVVLNKEGYATFQQLQNYQNTPTEHLYYYVFDLLFLDGEDLRELPLRERKKRLQQILVDLPAVRYSEHVEARGVAFFKEAQHKNIEGIMAKLATSPYRTGKRSTEWLKIKTHLRQEVVIGGFTEPKGKRKHIGALILGVYEKGKFTYVGQSGSGFNTKSLAALKAKLDPLVQQDSPFSGKVKPNAPATWVKPQLVAEISFAEWTSDGLMRQAIFEGLREDKKARDVVRETAEHTEQAMAEATKAPVTPKKAKNSTMAKAKKQEDAPENVLELDGQQVPLTSLDKLYWPEEGYTKQDLITYYQSIADTLLPYLKDRPESLLRHPNGIDQAGFFQKNAIHTPDWVRKVPLRAESTGEEVEYIVCDNKATLAYLNNLGCIQLNPWNSRVANLEHPDYMVIDLDPGENTYDEVVETALATKAVLDKAGASCFCKTSGATGMHLYVPLGAKYPFEQVRNFAHLVVQQVHAQLPQLTSLERSPKERRKQVYLDYLQNSIGQTVAAPYCVRPRPGATVSTPLQWKEVKPGLDPKDFTIKNVPARLKKLGDIFKDVLGKGIDLTACQQKLQA